MPRNVLAAVTATGLCVAASSALAQDPGAATAGGDVTADEATPLPPVVVQAPSEPPRRRKAAKRQITPPSTGVPAEPGESDLAGTVIVEGPAVAPLTLGQIDLIGGATITNEAMWTYNKHSLEEAVNILPGVTMHNSGGSRNERDIYVRGFDRFRVPLYMDGVRIYLPYDNRLDMNRFLTPDLAEIQVQKGYVSVLNGPGGMGGAINMVSRKPTKAVELEGRSGVVMNGGLDDLNQWTSHAYAGTRQRGYYAQVSGTIVDRDHFNLSDDFQPATSATLGYTPSFPYEDGGDREHSEFRDWRVNAKIGITPNATDEYSVNYTTQRGEKSAPLHTHRQIIQGIMAGSPRFWEWPQWDISTLSWLSKTQLGDASYVKTNAYYNTFKNVLSFYPDASYTQQTADSPYDDHSYGGFVEMGTKLIPMSTLKAAIHYRRDVHKEGGINYNPDGTVASVDDTEQQSEETWSFAVENTFHATRNLDIVTGVSYDINRVLRADGSTDPKPELDAWNGQAALIYSYTDTGKVHASVSSRTRFPTLFDRYSTRFGARSQNPDTREERATNYEIGWSDTIFTNARVSSAVFYSDIEDSIQNLFYRHNNPFILGANVDGHSYGFELSVDWDIMPGLRIGGNYTYLERDFDYATVDTTGLTADEITAVLSASPEGTPRHQAFVYLAWSATPQLTLTPSVELASDRSSMLTSCASTLLPPGGANGCPGHGISPRPNYARLGSYALVNFQAEYAFSENATAAVGVTNLLDENYSLSEGFPEAGRQFFANARVRF